MNSKLKKAAAVAAILGLALTAGISVALWTSSGTGSGRARTLTAQTITVNAATGSADLYPGFSGGDLHFTMTNPNPYGVVFTSMTPGAVTSSDPTNCPASNLTVVPASSLSLPVGANATSGVSTIANVATLATSAPDGCQGVSFDVAVTLTGSQV